MLNNPTAVVISLKSEGKRFDNPAVAV